MWLNCKDYGILQQDVMNMQHEKSRRDYWIGTDVLPWLGNIILWLARKDAGGRERIVVCQVP